MTDATAEYFSDQDAFTQWLEEQCERGPRFVDTSSSLFASWRNFAKDRGEEVGSSKRFSASMQRLGFQPVRDMEGFRGRGYRGVVVRVTVADPQPASDAGRWQ